MRKINAFIILLCGIIMISCSSTTKITVDPNVVLSERYTDKSYNDIVVELGAPDRTTPDGAGGTILIYEYTQTITKAGYTNIRYTTNGPVGTPSAQTSSYTHYTQFFINDNNICYTVKTNAPKFVVELRDSNGGSSRTRAERIKIASVFAGLGVALLIYSYCVNL